MSFARAGLLFVALLPAALAAQVDTTGRRPAGRDTTAARDTTVRDTTARDTTARDTTARDTVSALLPTFGPAIMRGPLPRGTRYVFTSDSVLLSNARTLSDVLAHIPGVYIARGGWYGAAEIVLYGGRGPASLEVYWDGVPMLPLGRDSLYLDPARIPLGPVERVDVIVLPAQIRVYLVTTQYRSTAPRTQVGIVTGQADIADYRAGYSIRTHSGIGVTALADWASVGNAPLGVTTPPFGTSDIWVKADYVRPNGRLGASFQISSSAWHRAAAPAALAGKVDGVDGWRQDRRERLLQVFAAERNDGLGWRVTATLANTGISHDTLVPNRSLSDAALEISQTWRHATVSGIGRLGGAGFPTEVEGQVGWMPVPFLTLSGSLRQSFYTFDRKGAQAYGTAGLTLPLGFSARAELAWRKDPQSPLMPLSLVTQQGDVAGWVRFDHRRLSIEVGRGRRDPFEPFGFAVGLKSVRSLNPTPLTEFVAVRASMQVVPGLSLSGWYFDPVVGGGDFEPPHHSRISATFYSKFWRVFKSGIFALRAEVAMESWGRSRLGGLDSLGNARGMTGSSFVDTNLEMQLAGVTLFWSINNINIMRSSYVTGLGYPKAAQQYGARWFFTN